jgi:hypothetical protein
MCVETMGRALRRAIEARKSYREAGSFEFRGEAHNVGRVELVVVFHADRWFEIQEAAATLEKLGIYRAELTVRARRWNDGRGMVGGEVIASARLASREQVQAWGRKLAERAQRKLARRKQRDNEVQWLQDGVCEMRIGPWRADRGVRLVDGRLLSELDRAG